MTNPNDPWGQRPEHAPTEHLGPPGKSGYGEPSHTTEYTEAYGTVPSEYPPVEYPPTEQLGSWAPPGPNATRELPRYDNQWPAYSDAYGQRPPAYPGGGLPPGGGVPPGMEQQPPRPPKRNIGLWIALGVGVLLLIGALSVVAGVLFGASNSSSTDSAAPSSAPVTGKPAPQTRSATPTQLLPSGLPTVPGMDGLGTTMGTVTANDGSTLTVESMLGGSVTVRTDASTQVIALAGSKVSDLRTGELVLIQGDKAADGSVHAKIIISTSLPGGGR